MHVPKQSERSLVELNSSAFVLSSELSSHNPQNKVNDNRRARAVTNAASTHDKMSYSPSPVVLFHPQNLGAEHGCQPEEVCHFDENSFIQEIVNRSCSPDADRIPQMQLYQQTTSQGKKISLCKPGGQRSFGGTAAMNEAFATDVRRRSGSSELSGLEAAHQGQVPHLLSGIQKTAVG